MSDSKNESVRLAYPAILALGSAALWGAATPASKALLTSLPPSQLAGLMYLGAAVGILPVAIRAGTFRPPWAVSGRNQRLLAASIGFGGIAGPLLLLFGLRLASATSVSMWLPLELVATAIMGRMFFRERIGRLALAGLIGVVTTSVILSLGERTAGLAAGAFVTLACVSWALDNNCTALIDGMTPSQITFWKCAVAGTVNFLIGIFVQGPNGTPGVIIAALGAGALTYGASIALFISAAQSLGATRAQMFFAAGPFFGVIFSAAILEEAISPVQAASGLILAGSLVLIARDRHNHRHVHALMTHRHVHQHDDGHHTHRHSGLPLSMRHSHEHAHGEITHAHAHVSDLHHRHEH